MLLQRTVTELKKCIFEDYYGIIEFTKEFLKSFLKIKVLVKRLKTLLKKQKL